MLSYAREHTTEDDDIVLCVNNLSRFPQPVELDLRRWEGCPRRAARRRAVPRDRRAAYLLTLGGYGFYWFRLTTTGHGGTDRRMTTPSHDPLELLAAFLERARWFGGKGRPFTARRRTPARRGARRRRRAARASAIDLVTVEYADADGGTEHLPAAAGVLRRAAGATSSHALVGDLGRRGPRHRATSTTRVHDRDAMALLARRFADAADADGPLRFHRLPGHELDLDGPLDPVHRRAVATPRWCSARTR